MCVKENLSIKFITLDLATSGYAPSNADGRWDGGGQEFHLGYAGVAARLSHRPVHSRDHL